MRAAAAAATSERVLAQLRPVVSGHCRSLASASRPRSTRTKRPATNLPASGNKRPNDVNLTGLVVGTVLICGSSYYFIKKSDGVQSVKKQLAGANAQATISTGASSRVEPIEIKVGQYNLLCPAYGVKWGEREACTDWVSKEEHGGSNWTQRLPAINRLLGSVPWDVLALEELEARGRQGVTAG